MRDPAASHQDFYSGMNLAQDARYSVTGKIEIIKQYIEMLGSTDAPTHSGEL